MAILKLENGRSYTDLQLIKDELASLNITLNYWSVGNNPQLRQLLAKDSLSQDEKEVVLQGLDGYFEQLKQTEGYQSRDLIVLNPDIPNLDEILAKFKPVHFHADNEVRYIIDGEGIFGFVCPDGSQIELKIQPEEYINVPARTEHWFYLTSDRRIKAVRYFTNTEGWVPEYTGTEIRFSRNQLTVNS